MDRSTSPSGGLVQLCSASTTFGSPLSETSGRFASQSDSSPQCPTDADRGKAPALPMKQGSENGEDDDCPSSPRAQDNQGQLNRMQKQTRGLHSLFVLPYSTVEEPIYDRRTDSEQGHNPSQCSIAATPVPPDGAAPTTREGGMSAEFSIRQYVILWHVHTQSLPHRQGLERKHCLIPAFSAYACLFST